MARYELKTLVTIGGKENTRQQLYIHKSNFPITMEERYFLLIIS
jgi:hypothetical protein